MGVQLTDDFVLEGLLGRGGMGSVHAALQRSTGRRVAVKLLPQDALDAERIARFEREAAALSRLSHPNIVHIYTHGRDADGRPFLAMELVAGRTLQAVMAAEAPLDVARAVTLAVQIVEGLAYAHEHQIAHRDVKPSNVMVARVLDRELVKLVDFGLAKLLDDSVEAGTQSGRLLGSAPYMSPEQWNQKRDIDGRADLYSFGCVFYELLTGRPPFAASGLVGFLKAHLTGVVADPTQLRPELAEHPEVLAIVARTMATDRDARPADARELLAALRPLELRYRAALASLPELDRGPAHLPAGADATRSAQRDIGAGWVSSVMTEPAPSASEHRGGRRRRVFAAAAAIAAVIAAAAVIAVVVARVGGGATSEVPPGSMAVPTPGVIPRDEPVRTVRLTAAEVAEREPAPVAPVEAPEPRDVSPTPRDVDVDRVVAPASEALVVHVESRPTGAEVVYDGSVQGTTPLDVTLRDGAPARLVVRRAGYVPRTVELDGAQTGDAPVIAELVRVRRHEAPPGSAETPEPVATPDPPALDLDRLPIE